jgi:predicted ABC-type ATPase
MFVFLDSPEACMARIRERVRKGGHDVPEADVLRRYERSISNFWRAYRKIADDWILVYNAGNKFTEVAIGDTEGISVLDESVFRKFVSIAESD